MFFSKFQKQVVKGGAKFGRFRLVLQNVLNCGTHADLINSMSNMALTSLIYKNLSDSLPKKNASRHLNAYRLSTNVLDEVSIELAVRIEMALILIVSWQIRWTIVTTVPVLLEPWLTIQSRLYLMRQF